MHAPKVNAIGALRSFENSWQSTSHDGTPGGIPVGNDAGEAVDDQAQVPLRRIDGAWSAVDMRRLTDAEVIQWFENRGGHGFAVFRARASDQSSGNTPNSGCRLLRRSCIVLRDRSMEAATMRWTSGSLSLA